VTALTIVMYHYVRPLEGTRYPGLKARRVAEFARQLDHVTAHHRVVGLDDVVAALRGGPPLPPRAALLTFDDGLADHRAHALPLLAARGLRAAFFPPAAAVLDRRLLDVHRIHFVLAAAPDPAALRAAVDDEVAAEQGPDAPARHWAAHGRASRFDPAEVAYVKRMLQVVLPAATRGRIAARLFARFVGADEAAFADELYLSLGQVLELRDAGMAVGAHGDEHRWLGSLPDDEQRAEVDRGLDLLALVGADPWGWAIAYPYGDWDDRLLALLRARSCALGLTTAVRVADLTWDDPLLLPRLDTNDLPC